MQPDASPIAARAVCRDPAIVRWGLTLAAVAVLGVLVVVPVVHVFWQALADGPAVYWNNLVRDPATRHALALTLTVVPIAVGLNLVFGIAVAWAVARFRFPGVRRRPRRLRAHQRQDGHPAAARGEAAARVSDARRFRGRLGADVAGAANPGTEGVARARGNLAANRR